ncbi:MAG: hypothetical protein RDV48_05980 [Candidatus Eremiobacteraeota bacterium]|nr:hypothetical protein [Candidatus Eremiobacteraeota bacterium]
MIGSLGQMPRLGGMNSGGVAPTSLMGLPTTTMNTNPLGSSGLDSFRPSKETLGGLSGGMPSPTPMPQMNNGSNDLMKMMGTSMLLNAIGNLIKSIFGGGGQQGGGGAQSAGSSGGNDGGNDIPDDGGGLDTDTDEDQTIDGGRDLIQD